jgi:hypothetical protein
LHRIQVVIAGLDPAIHPFSEKMDHRVTALRAGPVMTKGT